ncbi:MAG: NAD-dependent epimerase/dehydratase family protein [Flavobacteriales bacterium]|nr:NAD-dependent epimerase/dehydratase family protein [Flavobacteriales bacterium]MBK9288556.1 NAD-dependent epimerase/dehydratase family protein [Flavobacteriales bacterium]MCC7501636.1 NAD-dependent epimerase/dehydratase family protein [Flavobacteriales bacterium]
MPVSLVTGGAGFMGAHLVKELLSMGHTVVALDDLSGGFRDQVDPRATFVQGSINDYALLDALFEAHKFDNVYHLAAYAAEGLSHFIRGFNYQNNLIGSINLINASVRYKVKCFVFTSSIAVYGALHPPMREDMQPVPEDPYGVAKLAVELDLYAARHMFGLNYVVFRPHNVYGEYQNIGDRYRNVVGIFMNQLMQGQSLSVFGDGLQQRAFSYVGDIAPVMARCVDVPEAYGQVFNIGADTPYTVVELAGAVMEAMGVKGELKHVEARNEVVHAWSDHSKLERIFGKQPNTPLVEGLTRMADWAKRTGARQSKTFGHIEITEKLPPFWAAQS